MAKPRAKNWTTALVFPAMDAGHHSPVDGDQAADGHHDKLAGHDDECDPHRCPINRHQRDQHTADEDFVSGRIEECSEHGGNATLSGDGSVEVVGERGDRDQDCRHPEKVIDVGVSRRQDEADDGGTRRTPQER